MTKGEKGHKRVKKAQKGERWMQLKGSHLFVSQFVQGRENKCNACDLHPYVQYTAVNHGYLWARNYPPLQLRAFCLPWKACNFAITSYDMPKSSYLLAAKPSYLLPPSVQMYGIQSTSVEQLILASLTTDMLSGWFCSVQDSCSQQFTHSSTL